MWKLGLASSRHIFSNRVVIRHGLRTFLSESFKLEQAWNERLASPILKKINVHDMFYELDHQFQHYANASALDIDLFVNAIDEDSNFDEVEDVVHKLRLSPEAVNILPSTQHALIRLYLKCNKTDDLLRVLDDRMNYGIFPDDYCSLLLLDTFIKSSNFRDAAKVGVLSMLQEDLSNPLINYMSLFSCHKYIENPVKWNEEPKEEISEEEDDDEEVKVRVKFIRNPYFDDHFDLVDPNHLVGKTLHFIGSNMNNNIGNSYKLLGLILHDKLDTAVEFTQQLLSTKENNVLVKDGLLLSLKCLEDKFNGESKDETLTTKITNLKNILQTSFQEQHLSSDKGLLDSVEETIKDLVLKHEKPQIEQQLQYYKEWEKLREQLLAEQILKLQHEKQLAEVQRQKQILQEKEEELYFFDNEDKLDLIIEEKDKIKEERREFARKVLEAKQAHLPKQEVKKKGPPVEPPLEDFIDENIPMKLIKTKLN